MENEPLITRKFMLMGRKRVDEKHIPYAITSDVEDVAIARSQFMNYLIQYGVPPEGLYIVERMNCGTAFRDVPHLLFVLEPGMKLPDFCYLSEFTAPAE